MTVRSFYNVGPEVHAISQNEVCDWWVPSTNSSYLNVTYDVFALTHYNHMTHYFRMYQCPQFAETFLFTLIEYHSLLGCCLSLGIVTAE